MFRNIPTVTKNLLIVNFLAFLATWILQQRGIDLADFGGLHFFLANNFHLYQFVTYMFLHANLTHIFFNMFALWMFGVVVENVWGPKKFLFYYISCGIGAGLMQELVQLLGFSYISTVTIGASGAVYAILLAFGMIFPNERIFIFPLPIPIKAKWFVCGYAAIELFSAISSSGDGVAHMAHLGGMLFGFLMIRYWNSHPDSRYNRSSGQEFFESMKRNFERRRGGTNPHMHAEQRNETPVDDMEYNARKKQNQDEIDAILDKIRKSGYDSLTKEEKKKLFEASRNS
ncbi:MAG: rhomboid family intramembrane serine protease [Prevotella sp.]|nr:rhomboid family intramembrane serine protease [Prevotella sp.]